MNEKDLENLASELRALAAATADAQAPERVEAALLAAFRAPRPKPRTAYWLAAAAAIFVVLGAAAAWIARPRAQAPVAVLPEPIIRRTPAPAPPPDAKPVAQFSATPTHRAARPRVKPRPAAPAATPEPQEEVATEFMPLDYGPALTPMEAAEIVRVRMARGAMVRFGLPVNPDRMMEPVKADIVFGHDGIARAVRFVR